jgi:hypothetical protein
VSKVIGKLITDRSLTFYVGSTPYTLDRDAETFAEVRDELNKMDPDVNRLIELVDVTRKVKAELEAAAKNNKFATNYLTKGVIEVTRSGVTFNGEPIHNVLTKRLMDVMKSGLRLGPWIQFAENVYQNPAEYAREELYEWLEKSDLPITDDGCFLAYKIVRSDYKDIYSGKFDNSPGRVVQLSAGRQAVDPERHNTCSYGLHFCSKGYLPHYSGYGAGNRILLVKINPADVVSIPSDYNNAKGRTWRYEVLADVTADQFTIENQTWEPVYNVSDDYDEADDDWDSLEDEYEEESERDERISELLTYNNIVQLRGRASALGLSSNLAWKVYSKQQLAEWIADNE